MRNILATGVSNGVGLAFSSAMLNRYPDLIIYGVSKCRSGELNDLMERFPGRMLWHSLDLGKPFDLAANGLNDFLPPHIVLDAFLDNASIYRPHLLTQLNEERIMETMNVNLFSPMMLTKFAVKNFLRHKTPGSIVHVSSIAAHIGFNATSVYSAAKGGIEAFSRNVAQEWGTRKIRSNVVTLGLLDIGMSRQVPEKLQQKIKERALLKTLTDTDTIIHTIDFLLSGRSASITGENIQINAGVYMS